MAKVGLNKLGLVKNTESVDFMWKGQKIEVIQYLPLEKKLEVISKEEDGVKFWKFSHSLKGDGIFDKIYSIFKMRLAKAQSKGETYNIFDLNKFSLTSLHLLYIFSLKQLQL